MNSLSFEVLFTAKEIHFHLNLVCDHLLLQFVDDALIFARAGGFKAI